MSSEWQQSAIDRRDFRSDPDPTFHLPSKRKSTKKWCKGKMGVLHEYAPHKIRAGFAVGYIWEETHCLKCGKKDFKWYEDKELYAAIKDKR